MQKLLVGSRPRTITHLPGILLFSLIGCVALLPRVAGLTDFLTTDEVYHWIIRVERFSAAVADRNWSGTMQTGHPGVTNMWLGSLGLAFERVAVAQGWATVAGRVEHLAWLRLPSAMLQTLLVPLSYLLLRRLVAPLTALLAALLWAASPHMIAHSRLLHLDALLTAFSTLSLLCVLIACRAQHPLRWIAASGVGLGLALLTKGPALILLPSIGLILLWQVPAATLAERIRRAITWYALWIAMAALIVVALWPALWTSPVGAIRRYVGEIVGNGGRPNGDGQFFLGRAVGDPGPLFYIVANAFRTTPVELVGLIALPLALWQSQRDRRVLLALGAFALFWTLVMTLGPKKFDRYVLPTWLALLVLAAAGLAAIVDLGARLLDRGPRDSHALSPVSKVLAGLSGALLALSLIQPLITYHPYYLSYYNPLLGGGRAAQRTLLIGWGEGQEQVGAYLRTRPDIGYGPVLSALPLTLQPFVPVPVKSIEEFGKSPANYAVVYLESLQRGDKPAIYDAIRQTAPLKRITIHGIDYATIYQLPKPFEKAVTAQFGDGLRVRGVTVTREPGQLIVTPAWDVRESLPADFMLFMHLLDSAGQRVAQIDVPPGGGEAPATSAWQPGQQLAVPLPLPLPANLPSGDYRIVMGLYNAATGERLPLTEGNSADPNLAGPHAFVLDTIQQ